MALTKTSDTKSQTVTELDLQELQAGQVEQQEEGGFDSPGQRTYEDQGLSKKPKEPVEFGNPDKARIRKTSGVLVILIGLAILVLVDGLLKADDKNSGTVPDSLNTGVAIGLGIVSMVLCSIKYLYMSFTGSGLVLGFEVTFGLILLGIWIAGVILLTFHKDGTFLNEPSTGFFGTWLSLLMSSYYFSIVVGSPQIISSSSAPKENSSVISYKPGVTPLLFVALLLLAGVMAQASLHIKSKGKFKARAAFAISMAVPSAMIFGSMFFMKIEAYGDPNVYLVFVLAVYIMLTLVVLFCTFSEPFSIKVGFIDPDTANLLPDEIDTDFKLDIVANGFFSAIGAFVSTVVILWRSHKLILKSNAASKGEENFSINGRHYMLGFLFTSSLVLFIAAVVNCSNFDGCQENRYVSAALGLSFFSMVVSVLVFVFCRKNKDLHDLLYMDPSMIILPPDTTEEKVEIFLAFALFFMNAGGVIAFTFANDSPFSVTNTGYVFVWLSFIFASLFLNAVFPKLGLLNLQCLSWQPPNKMSAKGNFGFLVILVSCAVQVAAISGLCIEDLECKKAEIVSYAILAFILILTAILLSLKPTQLGHLGIILLYLLVLLVFLNLLLSTLVLGPFDKTQGNGFYSAWMGLLGAIYVENNYEFSLSAL